MENYNAGPSSEALSLQKTIEILSYTLQRLSHDIGEPIRTVACYNQLLANSSAIQNDPNLTEYVHFIGGAVERMRDLVCGILDYSRLLGQETPPLGQADMNVVVQTALANLHVKIEESGATVVCDSLPCVTGDYIQLLELVQNIISNGLKYRSAAPPQIVIRAEPMEEEVQFSIEDNGIGIDARFFESIFAPFKRLHGAEVPGAGLGLAICRQIVELHGGRIWVDSVPGEGSTFHFTLPAVSD